MWKRSIIEKEKVLRKKRTFCIIDFIVCFIGKNLLDWVGLGTGPHEDPYKARTNAACLQGDLAECFKSHALNSFEEFFSKVLYF